MARPAVRACAVGGCVEATIERRSDGVIVLRSTESLGEYPARLTDVLEYWAEAAPERTFVARRDKRGEWVEISYAQMLERARRIATALRARGLNAERPVAILAENSLEHLMLAFGAMFADVPYTPISPAYALLSRDYAKLRYILDTLTPGLVYATGPAFSAAIESAVAPDAEVVLNEGELDFRPTTSFASLLEEEPISLAHVHAQVGPDSVAKFLFTSVPPRCPRAWSTRIACCAPTCR